MPTYLVGPTRPYTTIQAALNAIPDNIAGTGIHEVIIDAGLYTQGNILTALGVGSDANNYIHLKAASGSEHNGDPDSGVRVEFFGIGSTITISSDYFRASNLVIKKTSQFGVNNPTSCISTYNQQRYENIILICAGDGYCSGVTTQTGNGVTPSQSYFYKCLAINSGTVRNDESQVGFKGGPVSGSTSTLGHNYILVNCGSYNFYRGYSLSTHAVSVSTTINCWSYHNGQFAAADFTGNFSASSRNNASRDFSANIGANGLINQTLLTYLFTNVLNLNFHIRVDSVLRNSGFNQSSLFTTDWDLQLITEWCIGPDSFSASVVAVPTTSSSLHHKTNAPHSKVADAKVLPAKKIDGEKSKGLGAPGKTGDASVTLPKSKKGQRSAFISIMPELNGYGAVSLGLGTGNMVPFYNETLTFNKEYREQDHVGESRAKQGRVSLFTSPSGSIEMPLRSNDIIPLFQSHFQKRIGTTPAAGTTFYEFTPSKGRVQLGGSAFGTGSYSGSGTSDAFSISLFKDYEGTGYHFKSGVVESLTFKVHSILEPSVTAECAFREGTVTRRSTSHPYGSYSLLPEFSPENCTVDFMGLPVLELEFQCRNRIERNNVVSGTKSLHKFGRYEVTGKALVDFSKQGFGYVGSMLNGASFPVSGTFRNGERDKIVFHMADCRLFEIPMNLNEQISPVSFKAYESDDGSTAPIKISVWTQNYSATSFQPN